MFNLPDRALYNRKIPKNKFYEKLRANTRLKDMFVEQVENIVWKYKISRETVNLEPTDQVEEIQVFEIYLKQKKLSKDILESIDKAIPYPILHVLIYKDEMKLAVAYKLRNLNNENRFIIHSYFESDWQPLSKDYRFNIALGSNLQQAYENIIKQLLPLEVVEEDLEMAVEKQELIAKLKKEITRLESKIKQERQFNRKVKLNLELQRKQQELNKLS